MKNATQKVAHNIEYEEAPSGHVTFYNYKSPLMPFEGGHGYVGALVFDGETDKIQCHFCGQWFDALGNHLAREHGMDAAYYKKAVGLNISTALINEKTRAKLIANGMEKRKKNLKSRKGTHHSAATRARISATLKENRDENKNLRGTCPDQLIDRLQKQYLKLGRTPTTNEITYIKALEKTYGSLKEACMVAGIPYRRPGQNRNYNHLIIHTKESITDAIAKFYQTEGRIPTQREIGKGIASAAGRYGGIKLLTTRAVAADGIYKAHTKIRRYTKDELIRFLARFKEINNRYPSYSDCKRGLLPHLSRYSHNFGSWKNALKIAFPGEVIKAQEIPDTPKVTVRAARVRPVLTLRQKYLAGKARVLARKSREITKVVSV